MFFFLFAKRFLKRVCTIIESSCSNVNDTQPARKVSFADNYSNDFATFYIALLCNIPQHMIFYFLCTRGIPHLDVLEILYFCFFFLCFVFLELSL